MIKELPIESPSLVDEIVRRVEDLVDRGEMFPGQQLAEEQLVQRWHVSRPSLREAFRVLEAYGYVERRARKGAFISTISRTSVLDLYAIRAVLEGLAVRLAVEKGEPAVIEKLKILDAKMRKVGKRSNSAQYSELNQDFHKILIEASGNELLQKQLVPINKIAKRYRRMAHMDAGLLADADLSHSEIISCMEARDGGRAELLRRERILKFAESIALKIS